MKIKLHNKNKEVLKMKDKIKKKNLIDGQEFIDELEKDLIDEFGEEEHKRLSKVHQKEFEMMMAISEERKEQNLNQVKVASLLDVSQQRISEIERNVSSLTLIKLLELLDVLDLDISIERKRDHKKIFHS